MAVCELVAYPLRDTRPLEMILCAVLEHVQRPADDRARQWPLEGMQQYLEILADARLRLRVAARERVDRERTDMTLFGLHQHRGDLGILDGCARGALEQEPRQRIAQQQLALIVDRAARNASQDRGGTSLGRAVGICRFQKLCGVGCGPQKLIGTRAVCARDWVLAGSRKQSSGASNGNE